MQDFNKRLNYNTDLCLCGSGKLLKDCCLIRRYLTCPKAPQTGYSNPRCYARDLGDCSKKISREHYISQGILRLFGEGNISASGLPWIPKGESRNITDEDLKGKMLCTRHNESLSPLDNAAKNFFKFFINNWNGKERIEFYVTNGEEIERWLLKTLCGLVASGNAVYNGKRANRWKPTGDWLQILFGDNRVGNNAGLYYIAGNYSAQARSINTTPVFKSDTGQPIALAFTISGIAFLFSMEEPPDVRKPTSTGAVLKYRPSVLKLVYQRQIREAHFGWPKGPFVSI